MIIVSHRTNAQNDALLHKLVHTRILSGSLNPELNLTPAQRKKALAGRVLEAAGKAKLGKGERDVRHAEHSKAAKRVREGLAVKQQERHEKQLEEVSRPGDDPQDSSARFSLSISPDRPSSSEITTRR